jgi:aminoglycoside 6-adenylyltransferase
VAPADEIVARLTGWAAADANVRRLLLVGSRAAATSPDDLADFDVQVYARSIEPYVGDQSWLTQIGRIWVCVADEYPDGAIRVPTRLAIFDGGVKVDFAFYPAGQLSSGLAAGLPFRILLAKDPSADSERPTPVAARPRLVPDELAYRRLVEEFWFEAYHVAKYLARGELWLAKSRDWATKQMLETMIDWHERIVHGRRERTDTAGRRSYIGADIWQALPATFGAFEQEDTWRAARETMHLFRRLANDVAAKSGYTYPADVDRNISEFIRGLQGARTRA